MLCRIVSMGSLASLQVPNWITSSDLQEATGVHIDQRRTTVREHAYGQSLLVLRGLIPVLQEVLGAGTKICMFLASIKSLCHPFALFWTLTYTGVPRYHCSPAFWVPPDPYHVVWCCRCQAASSPASQLCGWCVPGAAGAPCAQRSPAEQCGGARTLWAAVPQEHDRAGCLLRYKLAPGPECKTRRIPDCLG